MDGKVAVVTGAAGGIGRGVAELFAEQGASVVALDVQQIEPFAFDIERQRLDVRSEAAWTALGESLSTRYGRLDVLVNNAGVTGFEAVHELAEDEWQRVVGINQTAVFLGMRCAIPLMQRSGGGSIVNISSICGQRAVPGLAAYHASKGAVLLMTKNAAVTYAADGIRANAILPGWIRTPMTLAQADELNDAFIQATPMRRGAEPRDVAYGALYLACDESSYVTGVDLPVDGGYLAQ